MMYYKRVAAKKVTTQCTLRTEQWNNLERFKEKNSLREQQRMLQPETVTCQ